MASADRFEYKFLLSSEQREEIIAMLAGEIQPDTQGAPDGRYPIVSLYYDSPDLRCYWDKWRGVPSRRKLRIRVYGTADGRVSFACFIEVKHKADGRGAKRRVQTTLPTALALLQGAGSPAAFPPAEQRILEEVRRMMSADGLRPTCVMRYDRHAYFLPHVGEDEPLRITFDEGLAVRFEELAPQPDDRRFERHVLAPGQCIMEIKGSGAVPYALARKLTCARLFPRKLSKYGEAIRLFGLTAARAA